MKTLIDKIKELIAGLENNIFFDTSKDNFVIDEVITLLYKHTNGDLLH